MLANSHASLQMLSQAAKASVQMLSQTAWDPRETLPVLIFCSHIIQLFFLPILWNELNTSYELHAMCSDIQQVRYVIIVMHIFMCLRAYTHCTKIHKDTLKEKRYTNLNTHTAVVFQKSFQLFSTWSNTNASIQPHANTYTACVSGVLVWVYVN